MKALATVQSNMIETTTKNNHTANTAYHKRGTLMMRPPREQRERVCG